MSAKPFHLMTTEELKEEAYRWEKLISSSFSRTTREQALRHLNRCKEFLPQGVI